MSEIDLQIATLLDDVATTIVPRPRLDEVLLGGGSGGLVGGSVAGPEGAGGNGRPFRRGLAAAAAAALVLGGVAAALQLDDEAGSLATDPVTTPPTSEADLVPAPTSPERDRPVATDGERDREPTTTVDRPAVAYAARIGETDLERDPVVVVVVGTAPAGERVAVVPSIGDRRGEPVTTESNEDGRWRVAVELAEPPRPTRLVLHVGFSGIDRQIELVVGIPAVDRPDTTEPETTRPATTEPAPETTIGEEEPEPVRFTAELGRGDVSAQPMRQVVFGTATPGTSVLVTSAYGHVFATAGERGGWEAVLLMREVPAGTNVRITVTATGFPQEYEFWVAKPAGEEVRFTAERGAVTVDGSTVVTHLAGAGTPGSEVRAGSDFGVAEMIVGESGRWELDLVMRGVPAGRTVGIRVTNSQSDRVYEFSATRPAEAYDFTAEPAWLESDATPAFTEFGGTATPGATITVASAYGGGSVTAGEAGRWGIRVEFPEAPIGVEFEVRITSSLDDGAKTFGFRRVEPS